MSGPRPPHPITRAASAASNGDYPLFLNPRLRALRLLAALSFSAVFVACDTPGSLSPTSARQSTSSVFRSEAPRDVDLGSCTNLAVDPSEQVSAHLYAVGTQNYFWTGTAWLYYGPTADLFADPAGTAKGPGIFEGTTHIQRETRWAA